MLAIHLYFYRQKTPDICPVQKASGTNNYEDLLKKILFEW